MIACPECYGPVTIIFMDYARCAKHGIVRWQHARQATACEESATEPGTCVNERHDHFGQIEAAANGTGFDTGNDLLVCGDCRAPMHYDYGVEDYRHDDPTVTCFLIREGSQ